MNIRSSIVHLLTFLVLAAGSATSAHAADCASVGRAIAAQDGGTLQVATEQSQGGQTVCVVVYTVPGSNGQPPRRVERQVPAN